MSDRISSLKDRIAELTARYDQIQAEIVKVRLKYKNDPDLQIRMDELQNRVDYKRGQIKILRKRLGRLNRK